MLDIKYDIVGSSLRPSQFVNNKILLVNLRKVEGKAILYLVINKVTKSLKLATDNKFRRKWWHLEGNSLVSCRGFL